MQTTCQSCATGSATRLSEAEGNQGCDAFRKFESQNAKMTPKSIGFGVILCPDSALFSGFSTFFRRFFLFLQCFLLAPMKAGEERIETL
jgi:hypothetical protein